MSGKRQDFHSCYDRIRTTLMLEPYGHDVMSGSVPRSRQHALGLSDRPLLPYEGRILLDLAVGAKGKLLVEDLLVRFKRGHSAECEEGAPPLG